MDIKNQNLPSLIFPIPPPFSKGFAKNPPIPALADIDVFFG